MNPYPNPKIENTYLRLSMPCASGAHRPGQLSREEPSTAVHAISAHAHTGEGP